MPTINEIARRINSGEKIYLLDVRREREFEDYHIDGSVNLPFDEIRDVKYCVPDKDARIYLFCGTGQHSRSAATVLQYLGYKNVCDLGAMS